MGRCGSTVLADMLAQHNKVYWDGKKITRLISDRSDAGKISLKSIEKYLSYRMKGRYKKFYGFECELDNFRKLDFSMDDFIQMLASLGYDRFILLERKNHLKAITSRVKAIQTGKWHIYPDQKVKLETFKIDTGDIYLDGRNTNLLDELQYFNSFYQEIRHLFIERGISNLQLSYEEDISQNPMLAYQKTMNYLDLTAGTPKLRFKPTNAFPLRDSLENYKDVQSQLMEHPFKWMLDQ